MSTGDRTQVREQSKSTGLLRLVGRTSWPYLLLLPTVGSTVGQRILGIGLMSVNGRPASFVQVLLRTMLLCLAIPALIWDRNSRGLHDKAAATVLQGMVEAHATQAPVESTATTGTGILAKITGG